MPAAPLPTNESDRLADLHYYKILDTAPEPAIDALTDLTAKILAVPVCLVSLVDTNRQWFKSCVGLNAQETPRDQAFCAYAILAPEPLIIPDATADPRFADNPFVVGEPYIRFYAGVPLTSPRGFRLGTLCVVDFQPRQITPLQLHTLTTLAGQVIYLLDSHIYQEKLSKYTVLLEVANQENKVLNAHLNSENRRMSNELDVVSQLQRIMLPGTSENREFEGYDIATYMKPATEVGGDYYDVIPSSKGIRVGIGDVTGHGLESGMIMVMAQTIVATLTKACFMHSPAILNIANEIILANVNRMESEKNLSLSIVDFEEGFVSITGQHEEVLIIRANGDIERIDTSDLGFTIGLIAEIHEHVNQIQLPFTAGDIAVLYSDGVTEAMNHHREIYGIERLCQTVCQYRSQSAQTIIENVIAEVFRHIGSGNPQDDITLLVIKAKDSL